MKNEAIIKRLDKILKHYELSASVFADKINVQRSSLSHLLNGRNRPSLDFILKIDSAFPEVDLYWLLYGKGVFPSKIEKSEGQTHSSLAQRFPIKAFGINPILIILHRCSENISLSA